MQLLLVLLLMNTIAVQSDMGGRPSEKRTPATSKRQTLSSAEYRAYRALLEHQEDLAVTTADDLDETDPVKWVVYAYADLRRSAQEGKNLSAYEEEAGQCVATALDCCGKAKSGPRRSLALAAKAYLCDVKNETAQAKSCYLRAVKADPTCLLALGGYAFFLGNPPPDGLGRPIEAHLLLTRALRRGDISRSERSTFYFKFLDRQFTITHP